MPFSATFATRHTDTFAATGFVHVGVLLALTELAYAASEQAAGITKPEHIVAVEVATEARYHAPLPWQDGASITVRTPAVNPRGFQQTYEVRSAVSGRLIAHISHQWVWLDTTTGHALALPDDVQQRLTTLDQQPPET